MPAQKRYCLPTVKHPLLGCPALLGQATQDHCTCCLALAAMRNHQTSAAPWTRSKGRLRRGAAASEVTDLAAIPPEVRREALCSREPCIHEVT